MKKKTVRSGADALAIIDYEQKAGGPVTHEDRRAALGEYVRLGRNLITLAYGAVKLQSYETLGAAVGVSAPTAFAWVKADIPDLAEAMQKQGRAC